jgi:ligand-binding SRPBCC domain-containing protein
MKVYTLKQKQFIKSDLDTVWDYFSTPENLNNITPANMKFITLHMTGGSKMYAGQLISYKVSPFPFVRLRWTTEIRQVVEKKLFIDQQKVGPFALWYHQHFFEAKDGGVEMTDEVVYAIPFGWLGRVANSLFIANKVKWIFEFRRKAVDYIFYYPASPSNLA